MDRARLRLAVSVATLTMLGCGAPPPEDLGPTNGTLRPCPGTPNCVHTGLRHPEGTRGMYLADEGVGAQTMERLREVVESMPRTRVVTQTDGYIHAEATSLVFRFVDDLELFIALDGELVVRSASRVGRGDLGVNARRVEELRSRLQEAGLVR